MTNATPVAEASGAATPPTEKPPVAAAVVPPAPIVCPMTGEACIEKPNCVLPNFTGRTYCAAWVQKQRAA